jgi:hypothetical protein
VRDAIRWDNRGVGGAPVRGSPGWLRTISRHRLNHKTPNYRHCWGKVTANTGSPCDLRGVEHVEFTPRISSMGRQSEHSPIDNDGSTTIGIIGMTPSSAKKRTRAISILRVRAAYSGSQRGCRFNPEGLSSGFGRADPEVSETASYGHCRIRGGGTRVLRDG